jgi:hypothetical protein
MARGPEGTALLVAGYGALGASDASGLHTLGQIGEALLATGAAWQIRRLAQAAGARYAPDRGALKQHLDELSGEPARAAVLVMMGTITTVGGEPALVTSGQARDYPEDATLPLRWIRDRLRHARAEQVVAVISGRSDGLEQPAAWLDALGTQRPQHLVAAALADGDAHPIVDALLTALCGDALDPRTGTVTMASLSAYLGRITAAVQASEASETLAQPPPLAGLWDVRRSQLVGRAVRPRSAGDAEDLTGTVLPGRFRIDSLVARGTFGTVYRARQLAVERDVAVKVLHAEIDPASEDGRLFVHEIRSVGRIDHTNVVRIHQADITPDGRLFFAMELLDGVDLQALGAIAPLPRARAVELVRQLLAGLGAAHDAGLVHADVKPANAIVIEREGASRVVLVDFGLARLRAPDQPAESAGGTPAYMAPEQLQLGRVDARSDLFSAALVLVYLLTGWRRPNAHTPVPALDLIDDLDLRAVLGRALELEPARRYATARELSSALTGAAPPAIADPAPVVVAPFRQLAAFTEDDRGRLYGRAADLAVITQLALYRRSAIYTAPSGTGKTSMLRAGLVPRLEALGVRAVYLRCRADSSAVLAAAIWPDSATIAEAVTAWHRQRGGKLVIILDQVEAGLGDDGFVRDVLGFTGWPADADVAVVLSIREDHLARLLARAQLLEPGIPLVRLPPLGPDGARAAIIGPLTEARLAIEPELLDALLADLQRAAAAIGPEMGWGTEPAVFPPHLQLACSVLYDALDPGDATLTLAHYRRLGGFDAIVGEHLERVLDTELSEGSDQIARALFVALVTAGHERAMRPESELIAMVGDAERVTTVLEVLRSRGLLVRVRGDADQPSWELAHDSLVPRVLAWIDARDLARRRAIELVRYHLRRSRADAPSLLGRAELRELRPHLSAIAELDDEWQRRATSEPWTPSRLLARSRQMLRRRTAGIAAAVFAIAAVAGVSLYNGHVQAVQRDAEAALRLHNMGRFTLSLEPFDWDPQTQLATRVDAAALGLAWQLHLWSEDEPAREFIEHDEIERGPVSYEAGALVQDVEARGGRAFLAIKRRGCTDSLIPLKDLPGYADRERTMPRFEIRVPTCAATWAGMIEIPAGRFVYGGVGVPPSSEVAKYPDLTQPKVIDLSRFRIDATEVTNAAFAQLAEMVPWTGIAAPIYPQTHALVHAGESAKPVTGINWYTARAYCRYLGKDLPTSPQWVKTMRGGEILPDGTSNPIPERNFPFGIGDPLAIAALDLNAGTADVASHPRDISPYGVYDMTGNAQEWTLSSGEAQGIRIVHGGGIEKDSADIILDIMAIPNSRIATQPLFAIGVRCAINE